MPYGVAGGNVGSSRTIMPTFIGWRPSTSFSGSIAICSGSSLEVRGHRQLHDDAVDLGVAVQPADRRQQFVLGHERGQIDLLGTDPDVGARLVLGADVDARGLVVAHEDGGQARDHAPLLQARTRSATSERIWAAIALPSRIVAVTGRILPVVLTGRPNRVSDGSGGGR